MDDGATARFPGRYDHGRVMISLAIFAVVSTVVVSVPDQLAPHLRRDERPRPLPAVVARRVLAADARDPQRRAATPPTSAVDGFPTADASQAALPHGSRRRRRHASGRRPDEDITYTYDADRGAPAHDVRQRRPSCATCSWCSSATSTRRQRPGRDPPQRRRPGAGPFRRTSPSRARLRDGEAVTYSTRVFVRNG